MTKRPHANGVASREGTAGREPIVGGFFGLEVPQRDDEGLRGSWRVTDRSLSYRNARSAIRHVIEGHPAGRVWLPAYICSDAASVVPIDRLCFYAQDSDDLEPDLKPLSENVGSHDVVLAVNYFGRSLGQEFQNWARSRTDITFIEDCAQSFDPHVAPWGSWRVYSPRKLVGTPDGGLLVPGNRLDVLAPRHATMTALDATERALRPAMARFEDETEGDHQIWYALHQSREAEESSAAGPMSRLGWAILGLLDPAAISDRRRRNFSVLAEALQSVAYLGEAEPSYVPFCFPIRVAAERRDALLRDLHADRIFAAVHWRHLPSPIKRFSNVHELASQMISLPCDQRYDETDMKRIARRVRQSFG